MRLAAVFLMVASAACTSTKGVASPAAQEVVDRVAAKHPELVRLTLHAVPAGEKACTQVASTMAERRGKRSDPEDLEAMRTGRQIVLSEPGAVDVTVPILVKSGKPTAIAGVTVRAAAGADRDTLVARAVAIAQELEGQVRAAGKPLW